MNYARNDDEWDDEADDGVWNEDEADDDDDQLAECPSCGAEIYDEAVRCPRCGNFVVRSTSPLGGRPWWWIVLGILGILAVILTSVLMQ